MTREQKIEYVKHYLQHKLEEHFVYPFRITYEDKQLTFYMKYGKNEYRVRTRSTNEIIHTVLLGRDEQKEVLIRRILQLLQAAVTAQESTVLSDSSDYERMRGELILRPLSYRMVKEEIKDVPHIRIGDIALVLYAVMAHVGGDYFTAKIRRSQIAGWKCSEEEILEEALVNTSFLYPPRIYSMEDLFCWEEKRQEDGIFMGDAAAVHLHSDAPGYILTNTLEINGAVAMFYPGVAEQIAEAFESDFYIAFTSIHEVQIHPAKKLDPEVIGESLQGTNRVCNRKEDILTNRVYGYSRQKGDFYMFVDGMCEEVGWNDR